MTENSSFLWHLVTNLRTPTEGSPSEIFVEALEEMVHTQCG